MSDPTMRDRVARLDLDALGLAYCQHAGLSWLSWPLRMPEQGHADWFGSIVRAVATAPVCGRTAADALADLGRIEHVGLRRLLPRVREMVAEGGDR